MHEYDFDLQKLTYDPEDCFNEFPGGIDNNDLNEINKHLMELAWTLSQYLLEK